MESRVKDDFTGTELKVGFYMSYLDCWTEFILIYIHYFSFVLKATYFFNVVRDAGGEKQF